MELPGTENHKSKPLWIQPPASKHPEAQEVSGYREMDATNVPTEAEMEDDEGTD